MSITITPKPASRYFLYILFIIASIFIILRALKVTEKPLRNIIRSLKDAKQFERHPLLDYSCILLWNNLKIYDEFSTLNCSNKKCVFTENRYYLKEYREFDAIIFDHSILESTERPVSRSPLQIYIFNSIESSYSVPACELYNDGFFNLTFTYRLDSDVVWNFFVVRNLKGDIVAPSLTAKWQTNIHPVRKKIKKILANKSKAAAWLVRHCKTDSLRDEYLTRLQEHLSHFSLKIDVYGSCTNTKCPNNSCEEMLMKDYYFYMAFENSFAEDYVTAKVLHGYNNFAVPIVYGGANYSRFLPPGSYINAREIHPYNLANLIYQAMISPAIHQNYFRWTNLYTVDANIRNYHPLCKLCSALNRITKRMPAMEKFRLWWNGLSGMKWCLSKEYWRETANVNMDAEHVFNLY